MTERVINDWMSTHCVLDLEDSKPIFSQDTLAYNDASSYQGWLQKVQTFRRYCLAKHSLTFWTFAVTLTLNTAIQFSHKILRHLMMSHQDKFACKRINSSDDRVENSHILSTPALETVSLTLKLIPQSLCATLRLMMMHNNAKFDNYLREIRGLNCLLPVELDLTYCRRRGIFE